jgi:23S rRNA (adenine2030-N6)-methyltransferase
MNYNHLYHAGNFADIFKHYILSLCLNRLKEKDSSFFILDAFAGSGLYPLTSYAAQTTKEYKNGIEKFMKSNFEDQSLKTFQNLLLPSWNAQIYNGSPLQISEQIRLHDRFIANELHSEFYDILLHLLGHHKNIFIKQLDAYESIKAHIPPPEKRGLILIDPPFERRDEFEVLIESLKTWYKKFPQGHYAIWYPIKANDLSLELNQRAKDIGFHRTYRTEILRTPREQPHTFNGSGMLLLNAPFTVVETLRTAKDELGQCLQANIEIELLTTE